MVSTVEERGEASIALGIVQELRGQALDFGRHGGREEQRLAGERQELADALDIGDEAHVEHAVGLVDDQHLDAGQQQAPRSKWSRSRPGRGDHHIGAAVDLERPGARRRRRR